MFARNTYRMRFHQQRTPVAQNRNKNSAEKKATPRFHLLMSLEDQATIHCSSAYDRWVFLHTCHERHAHSCSTRLMKLRRQSYMHMRAPCQQPYLTICPAVARGSMPSRIRLGLPGRTGIRNAQLRTTCASWTTTENLANLATHEVRLFVLRQQSSERPHVIV